MNKLDMINKRYGQLCMELGDLTLRLEPMQARLTAIRKEIALLNEEAGQLKAAAPNVEQPREFSEVCDKILNKHANVLEKLKDEV